MRPLSEASPMPLVIYQVIKKYQVLNRVISFTKANHPITYFILLVI
jgi:hypothetical protein